MYLVFINILSYILGPVSKLSPTITEATSFIHSPTIYTEGRLLTAIPMFHLI